MRHAFVLALLSLPVSLGMCRYRAANPALPSASYRHLGSKSPKPIWLERPKATCGALRRVRSALAARRDRRLQAMARRRTISAASRWSGYELRSAHGKCDERRAVRAQIAGGHLGTLSRALYGEVMAPSSESR